MVSEAPQGSDYRFLYIFLLNRGGGWQIAEADDKRDLSQILIDHGYEMVYHPEYDGDIAVGKKEGSIVGVATVFGLWAIDLTDRTLKDKNLT